MTKTAKRKSDLASGFQSFVLLWGLPVLAMAGSIFLSHLEKTLTWIAADLWMGLACLVNARRCGRTHCYYTGPFFLAMAVAVFLHGFALAPLGSEGWNWLGNSIGIGAAGIWCLSEKLLGKYRR